MHPFDPQGTLSVHFYTHDIPNLATINHQRTMVMPTAGLIMGENTIIAQFRDTHRNTATCNFFIYKGTCQ